MDDPTGIPVLENLGNLANMAGNRAKPTLESAAIVYRRFCHLIVNGVNLQAFMVFCEQFENHARGVNGIPLIKCLLGDEEQYFHPGAPMINADFPQHKVQQCAYDTIHRRLEQIKELMSKCDADKSEIEMQNDMRNRYGMATAIPSIRLICDEIYGHNVDYPTITQILNALEELCITYYLLSTNQ